MSTPVAIFTPPTDLQVGPTVDYFGNTPADADPAALAVMKYFVRLPRGRNVYLMNDGSVSEVQPPNWDGTTTIRAVNPSTQLPYAWSFTYAGGVNPPDGVVTFTLPANQQVRNVYWGGHPNPITAAEKAILCAAGYGPYIVPPCANFLYPHLTLYPDGHLYPHSDTVAGATWSSFAGTWASVTVPWNQV